jgi:hypothetical protein
MHIESSRTFSWASGIKEHEVLTRRTGGAREEVSMTSEMATEKRLIAYDPITFEAFTRSIIKHRGPYDYYDDGYIDAVERVEEWLEQNTVDAAPVVHGKWELRNVTSGINGRYWCCTACGCIRSYWEYEPDDNYCFKCGAKMDGERRTDNG